MWIARRSHHVFGVDKTEIAPPLPRPCCRKTFLAITVGDGKSELLKDTQCKAWAICHHAGPPPPPWQPPACCLSEKEEYKEAGTFEERFARTHCNSAVPYLAMTSVYTVQPCVRFRKCSGTLARYALPSSSATQQAMIPKFITLFATRRALASLVIYIEA